MLLAIVMVAGDQEGHSSSSKAISQMLKELKVSISAVVWLILALHASHTSVGAPAPDASFSRLNKTYTTLVDFCEFSYDNSQTVRHTQEWTVMAAWHNEGGDNIHATLLRNEKENFSVLVFRGSGLPEGITELFKPNKWADWVQADADIMIKKDLLAKNLTFAAKIAEDCVLKYNCDNLILTGHSKGAAEASYAAAWVKKPAIVYASPGLPPDFERSMPDAFRHYRENVANIYIEGDPIVGVGKLAGMVMPNLMISLRDDRYAEFRLPDSFGEIGILAHLVNESSIGIERHINFPGYRFLVNGVSGVEVEALNSLITQVSVRANMQRFAGIWDYRTNRLEFSGNKVVYLSNDCEMLIGNCSDVSAGVISIEWAWAKTEAASFAAKSSGLKEPWTQSIAFVFDESNSKFSVLEADRRFPPLKGNEFTKKPTRPSKLNIQKSTGGVHSLDGDWFYKDRWSEAEIDLSSNRPHLTIKGDLIKSYDSNHYVLAEGTIRKIRDGVFSIKWQGGGRLDMLSGLPGWTNEMFHGSVKIHVMNDSLIMTLADSEWLFIKKPTTP